MPIYEYICSDCHKQFSALVGMIARPKPVICPRCGGEKLTRIMSRFSRVRSEEDTLESLSDESNFGDIENDPKAMRKWVKEMGKAMDEDMEGDLEAALEEEFSGKGSAKEESSDETVY